MDHASTLAVPGYGPADCERTWWNVLKLIRADLQKWQGDKITGNYSDRRFARRLFSR